jgi:uncharacterized membrane-anchored protein
MFATPSFFPFRAIMIAAALAAASVRAASPLPIEETPQDSVAHAKRVDSIMTVLYAEEKTLKYQTGDIKIGDGLATAHMKDGYRFLDPAQSGEVLTRLWGNPPDNSTLGMIFPPGVTPLSEGSWAVIVSYDEDGYVKDDDAATTDYDKLLKKMQESMDEENKEREKEGYDKIDIVGWAEKPYYDKAAHKLHWAKELRFGDSRETTLNYNIRVLGRHGVLVLNAVSGMSEFAKVKEGVKPIIQAVEFDDGKRYTDFKPDIDKVATYGIAGLVAGTLLAKAGLFKLLLVALLAAKKFVIIGVVAVVAGVKKLLGMKSAKTDPLDVAKELPKEPVKEKEGSREA